MGQGKGVNRVTPQIWQIIAALAALLGGLYAIVTVPLLHAMKAEIAASEARMKLAMKEETKAIKADIATLQSKVEALEIRAWR